MLRADQVKRIESQFGDAGVHSVLSPVQRVMAARIAKSILS